MSCPVFPLLDTDGDEFLVSEGEPHSCAGAVSWSIGLGLAEQGGRLYTVVRVITYRGELRSLAVELGDQPPTQVMDALEHFLKERTKAEWEAPVATRRRAS